MGCHINSLMFLKGPDNEVFVIVPMQFSCHYIGIFIFIGKSDCIEEYKVYMMYINQSIRKKVQIHRE